MGRAGFGGGSSHSSSFHSSSHTSSVHHSSPSSSWAGGTSRNSSAPLRAGHLDHHDFGGHGRGFAPPPPPPPSPLPNVVVYTAAQNTASRSSYSSRTNHGSQENWDYPWGKPSNVTTNKKEDKWPTIFGVLIFLIRSNFFV